MPKAIKQEEEFFSVCLSQCGFSGEDYGAGELKEDNN